METVILAFLVSLVAIAGLAIGVMAGRAPIRGSCGGIACRKDTICAECPRRKEEDTP